MCVLCFGGFFGGGAGGGGGGVYVGIAIYGGHCDNQQLKLRVLIRFL